MSRVTEFLEDLRDNWDDHYWWARHQALQIALLSILSGTIGLVFLWARLRMERRYAT